MLTRHDPEAWLDREDNRLIEANDGPFKYHLDRTKYPDRHGSDAHAHRVACINLLRPLEDRLTATPYLSGEAMGFTDAAILPFVRQFASIDRGWFDAQSLPQVQQWLDSLIASDLFDAAMVRLTAWRTGDPNILFP